MHRTVVLLVLSLCLSGCDGGRIRQLEQENQELRSKLGAATLDLQAKCSSAAKEFVAREWPANSEPTVHVDHARNHYNTARNKCFVLVDTIVISNNIPIVSMVHIRDVFENAQVGILREVWDSNGNRKLTDCSVDRIPCKDATAFSTAAQQFMAE